MKYDITLSCGHKTTVEIFGKNEDRQKRIAYLEQYGLCDECRKAQTLENEKNMDLVFNSQPDPDSVKDNTDKDGAGFILMWFTGATMTHKDEIKALGYRWNGRRWEKQTKLSRLANEVEKAASIGAVCSFKGVSMEKFAEDIKATYIKYCEINGYTIDESAPAEEVEKEEIAVPEIIAGKSWNGKVYGRRGNYSIYPDGVKTAISDEQAQELKEYIEKTTE